MRLTRRTSALALAPLLLAGVLGALPATASLQPALPGTLQPWLAQHLSEVTPTTTLRVLVQSSTSDRAADAIRAGGLKVQQKWQLAGMAIGVGPARLVPLVASQPGVTYVEGDEPLKLDLDTAHKATRAYQAERTFRSTNSRVLDGSGVTVAVIDSGVDSLHPFFQLKGDGLVTTSKVVQNRKNVCGIDLEIDPDVSEACFASSPDTDTSSAGGHGTHVAGIVAGVPVKASNGKSLEGAAPGAKLVMLSVGAGLSLLDPVAAQNWVLEHWHNPCRSAAQQSTKVVDAACPPIRVTNHSYGPNGDRVHDPKSAAVKLQQALIRRGVVAVWSAGNAGGNGAVSTTSPDGSDPTLGVLMVANYSDGGIGDREGALSSSSSRGQEGKPKTYPDLAAPGTKITSSCRAYMPICSTGLAPLNAGDYNTISGTSMAAPYIAGVVALLFQADPRLTPAKVEILLEQYAHRFGDTIVERDPSNTRSRTSYDAGHGLVDVYATLRAICAKNTGARCR